VNLVIAATVFPVIFLGELPDKTMFASLIMSIRGRPAAVWLGGAVAFAIHAAIAVTVGMAAVALLPQRVLDAVVALLFLAGAALVVREMRKDEDGAAAAAAAGQAGQSTRPAGARHVASAARVAGTAFAVIFVAEWGDLTQVLMANLAAHYHEPVAVGVWSVLALWAVTGLAVIGGRWLARVINVKILRGATAVVLTGFAAYAGWAALAA
jgi:Ca2+/H+ antiporter, TMEM165/GDT1 family